jgi:hypothetical protein
MAAFDSMPKRIKNALMLMLGAIQYDTGAGATAAFKQVLDNSRGVFIGWPNVQVLPGSMTDDRQSVDQADITVEYILRLRIPLEDTDQDQSSAFDMVYDLTDLIVDAVDSADQDSTLADGTGNLASLLGNFLMQASRGEWIVYPANEGDIFVCDVNVQITYSKSLH